MEKVTGLGGIFFKTKNPENIKKWYSEHLGLSATEWGTIFEWRPSENPEKIATTHWSPFEEDTNYFNPSTKDFMINFRVKNIEKLTELLRQEGVTILDDIESYSYGKFIHILDPEGNKIELWEPAENDSENYVTHKTS
ncbi:MAG: glyoxalase [Ignavibacteria bacterium GWF2_33_9]|nr:MAG: glyoxalase [Ignavibacteria bacterium GWF2_33_9]